MFKNGLFHLISAPPPPRLRTDLSLLPLKNSIKKCYPLKTSLRNGFTPEEFHKKSIYPWRIPWNLCLPLKNSTDNMGFTPKEFPSFWALPLKNSTTFIPYPWRIPLFLNRGGADIKWNSPMTIVHWFLFSVQRYLLQEWKLPINKARQIYQKNTCTL